MGGGKNLIWRRCQQLLVPYFAWSLIQFLRTGDYTFERMLRMITHPDTYFWFLWVLFLIFVLFHGARLLAVRIGKDELVVVVPLCILLMTLMVVLDFRLFGFQFLAYYFMFYTFGYAIHRFPRLQIGSPVYLAMLTVLWAVLAWWWNMHTLPSWVPVLPHVPTALMQYAYRGLTAVIAIMVLLGAAPRLLNRAAQPNGAVARLGIISLGLYVAHLTILGYVVSFVRYVYPPASTTGLVVLSAIAALLLSWGLVELLQKNKYTNCILLGKV